MNDFLSQQLTEPLSSEFNRFLRRFIHATLPDFSMTTADHRMADFMDEQLVSVVWI